MSNERELERLAAKRDRLKAELDSTYDEIAAAAERAKGKVPVNRMGKILGVSRAAVYDLLGNRR